MLEQQGQSQNRLFRSIFKNKKLRGEHMDVRDMMNYLGDESARLVESGSRKSNIVMNTVLQNDLIARMVVSVEIMDNK
jgi:hypothetical protein